MIGRMFGSAVGGALAVLISAPLLGAQEAERDTVPAARLAPVVVEVFRAPLDARRVPYSTTVVSGAQAREGRPGIALDEALRTVPGVQVDNRYNFALGERVSIRGFGARTQFGVRGVRIVADGVPLTFADGQSALEEIDPGAIARVEVVRGPASALYGNAAGGVILFRSAPPPAVPLRQEVRAVGGDHGLLRLESNTAGRSGGTAYQLRASHLSFAGYREHSAFHTVRINGLVEQELGRNSVRLRGSFVDFAAENPGALSFAQREADRFQAFPTNVTQQTGKDGRQGQVGVWLSRPLLGSELEISAHLQRRDITNPIPNTIIELARVASGARALLRGGFGVLGSEASWAVGAEMDGQWDDRRNWANRQGDRGDLTLDQAERVASFGAFSQLLVPLGETVTAMAGLRADGFRYHAETRFAAGTGGMGSGDRRMGQISPSVGVVWTPLAAASFYANYSTAFETPTTTELANRPDAAGGFNPELAPQETRSAEVGFRGEAGGGLSYQLAAYRAAVTNMLIPFQVPDAPGRDFFRNAGSAVHQGAEASLAYMPLPGLTLQLGHTYVDARFRDYRLRNQVFDGNRVPGVAPHRSTVGAVYRRDGGVFFGADGIRVSEIPVNDANRPGTASPSYTLVNARVGHGRVRVGRTDWMPFVGVNNLLDADYNTAVTINAFGDRFYEPGPGRSLYLGLTVGVGG
jgi:iron complex outermembrane recepter protein